LEHETHSAGAEMGELTGRELEKVDSFEMKGSVIWTGKGA
jgi:hypothetical protein